MVDPSFFENGKLKSVQKLPLKKRAKDWWIKGFQLNRCYLPHWDEIKDIFEHYDVDLNRQGPIMTLQTLKQVRLAKDLTEKIKRDPQIRKLAKNSSFPLRTVYYTDVNPEKFVDGSIFILLLRLIPEFCLELGMNNLRNFMENGNSKKHLEKAFLTSGTIMDTETDIEKIVKKMIKEVIKNGKDGYK